MNGKPLVPAGTAVTVIHAVRLLNWLSAREDSPISTPKRYSAGISCGSTQEGALAMTDVVRYPKWYFPFWDGLIGIRSLQSNWDGDGAPAPGETAVDLAQQALDAVAMADLEPSRVYATRSGTVSLRFLRGRRRAEIECYPTGATLILTRPTPRDMPTITRLSEADDALHKAVTYLQSYLEGRE